MNPPIAIPEAEFTWTYARAGGPGGQNVNKVSSKALLRWNLLGTQAFGFEAGHFGSGFFVFFVFKNLVNQFLPGVNLVALRIHFFTGKKHLGFDAHEGGDKQNKLAAEFNVQRFLLVNKGQEIVDDFGNRNIVNIQFVPLDKKKQEVKRTFKLG